MKVLKSDQKLNPFGGLNFVINELEAQGIAELIDTHLPPRSLFAHYKYSDVFYSMWSVLLCGGDCAEDLQDHLRPYLEDIPGFDVPSADTVLRLQQDLSGELQEHVSARGVLHQFCWNEQMNQLNVKLLKKLDLLSEHQFYTMDYDNKILFNEKSDSTKTYLKKYGYHPGVCLINNKVVCVEMHNGNSEPRYLQDQTLERIFDLLQEHNIKIGCFRADSASYQLETIKTVEANCQHFYIRARAYTNVIQSIAAIEDDQWEIIDEEAADRHIACISCIPFEGTIKKSKNKHALTTYRLVVVREPRRDGQINAITGGAYDYQSIITNDIETAGRSFNSIIKEAARSGSSI